MTILYAIVKCKKNCSHRRLNILCKSKSDCHFDESLVEYIGIVAADVASGELS